jgi:outer membrane protein assembly factor BamB
MRFIVPMLAAFVVADAACAEDWPQMMGPHRNNTTSEIIKPWKVPPRELWRAEIGEGSSTPLIVAGRVFVHAKVADKEEEELVGLDEATGKVLFRNGYGRRPYSSNTGNGPRTTPAVALGKVYGFGVTGILTCWSAETGKQIWQVDVHKKFGVARLRYGATSSPLIEGNRVLIHVGGPEASIAAFDADTGEVIWKALRDPITTSAPTLVAAGDGSKRQVVFQTALRIVGLDAVDGKLLWEYPLSDTPLDSVGAPVWTGEMLFSSSVHFGGRGFRIGERDGKPNVKEMWLNEQLGSYYASVVPAPDNHFFMISNTSMPGAALRCVDGKTGKQRWSVPDVAEWFAGLIGTGNGNLILTDGKGVLRLLAADVENYRELARAEVGITSSVAPVVANGRLYLRDKKQVLCLQVGEIK